MGNGRELSTFRASLLATALLTASAATGDAKPAQGPVAEVTASLPAAARAALPSIKEGGHRLLALRGYLRSARSLDKRWSWTEEEIEDYVDSPEYEAALADIEKVRTAFEAANEGYTLRVNTKVRSLDEQIANWNRNKSVHSAATKLGDAFHKWLAEHPKATAADVRNFLGAWQSSHSVSLAVPGFSPHGQARAFDFQIQKGEGVIAGASMGAVASVWDRDGWTEKLKAAMTASRAPFKGPLERPREPWHFDYEPKAAALGESEDSVASATGAADVQEPPIPRPRPAL